MDGGWGGGGGRVHLSSLLRASNPLKYAEMRDLNVVLRMVASNDWLFLGNLLVSCLSADVAMPTSPLFSTLGISSLIKETTKSIIYAQGQHVLRSRPTWHVPKGNTSLLMPCLR